MYPKYSSGDIVACKSLSLDTFFQWNKVYVVDTEQGVLIKRVRKGVDDDHILMFSENEKYEPFPLHRSEIRALAIVIGVIRLE
jgi:phage repressor protein C with HTH and peptisase S24 domain